MQEYCRVQVLLPIDHLPPLTYKILANHRCTPGSFVIAPFRNREITGIVWPHKGEDEIDEDKLKEIKTILTLPALPAKTLQFIEKAADYNAAFPGGILKMVIPSYLALHKNQEYYCKIIANTEEKADAQVANIKLPALSDNQQQAVNHLRHALHQNKYSVNLLDGVTGSGKTEVYFSVIADILKEPHGQALILLPEIVLTSQLIDRFSKRFGFIPYTWHSDLSMRYKKQVWAQILSGKARLVIGARSALFLPFSDLKLIVIDEEHDASYKQEEGICYHARDMAILKAHKENIPIILATATPALETITNCQHNRYSHLTLTSRYNKASFPEVKVVDMRSNQIEKNSWLSDELKQLLVDNYARSEQSLLFLNRRGYAPLTLCRSCGYRFMCPACSTWLVEHKSSKKLQCHHCGYHIIYPESCPGCGIQESFAACGPGVERIVEELSLILPQARIATMTRDTINSAKSAEETVRSILAKDVDIIVGTQMVAKGHHFPELSVVGIIDADLGLSGGDLRASERSYQLLHQVGGRAGREGKLGQVIVQTYNPDNIIIRALANNNRNEFIHNELLGRKYGNMPPFTKLAAIILSSLTEDSVRVFSNKLVKLAPHDENITVLGPVPALLSKLRGRYRYRILVKAERKVNLQKFLRYWLSLIKIPGSVRLKIDIDPYSFF